MSSVILITGASTGFGRNAAETLARRGHHVFATMRDVNGHSSEHRESLQRLAAGETLRLQVLESDVTGEASVQNAVQRALEQASRLDVVLNNAVFAALGVTEAYTPEQFQRVFDGNFYGVVRVNRAVLPTMRQQRSGLLIHVSSVAGRVVVPALLTAPASARWKRSRTRTGSSYIHSALNRFWWRRGAYRTPIFDRLMPPADAATRSQTVPRTSPARVSTLYESPARLAHRTPREQSAIRSFLAHVLLPLPTPASIHQTYFSLCASQTLREFSQQLQLRRRQVVLLVLGIRRQEKNCPASRYP